MDLNKRSSVEAKDAPTVFDLMLNPDTEKGTKPLSVSDQTGDAFLFLMAGADTTGHTLVTAVYSLLRHTDCLQCLRSELRETIPNQGSQLDWASAGLGVSWIGRPWRNY